MSTQKGQGASTKKKAKKSQPEIDLYVAPRNGKAGREIVAKWGDTEFPDVFDPFKATAREKFAERVSKYSKALSASS
ncbi:MAG: hypothetical protein J0I06_20545 [Planctomycetes bacterium]|nr:hypothetical protein [Planctomycetota bacterium]